MRSLIWSSLAGILLLSTQIAVADTLNIDSDISLTMNQNSYSKNWDGEEVGLLSWMLLSETDVKVKVSHRAESRNSLRLKYGMTASQDTETGDWSTPVKSSDRIDLESILRFKSGAFVDPYVSGRILTQFYERVSSEKQVFDPVTFTESIGAVKILADTKKLDLSTRTGFVMRQSFNRKMLVDPVQNLITTRRVDDGGIQLVSEIHVKSASPGISYKSRLTLFQALYFSESHSLPGSNDNNYWKTIDVDWENSVTANITRHLMVRIDLQLLYDRQVSEAGRLVQMFSLGFTHILF